MKKCVIYSRVSTLEQDNLNQIAQLEEYAHKQGWQIVDIVTDIASGSKSSSERDGLGRVFEWAHKKSFDVLLFWALDRLSREGSRKTIEYLTRLEQYGVHWHSFTEEYLSSLGGVFSDCIISLLASLSKQERIRVSERTKAGLQRTKRVNGTRLGRPHTPVHRIRQAKKLRISGLSFTEIGKEMGITRSRAHQLVRLAG